MGARKSWRRAMPEAVLIKISDIKTNPDIQIRTKVHEAIILEYVEALQEGDLAPISVVQDMNDGMYLLSDGHYRLESYVKDDRKKIPAIIRHPNNGIPVESEALYGAIVKN